METLSYGPDHPPATPTSEGIVLHGSYRLVSQIGYGGMGVVYEAVHTRLPGRFAVKVLLRSLMAYPEAIARFAREAEIMSELRHPHVVQIVDFNVTDEQQPYFVMEHLDGRDLEVELSDRGRLPLGETVSMVRAIASALGVAHRRGIVHRDLKPSNIFLCDVEGWQEPFVKVLDFGISKMRSAGRITNRGSSLVGTPHYMAPEQATGALDEIDGRTDQFALAAMAYAMLTGNDAFAGEDQVSVLYQIVHEPPRPMARWGGWDHAGVQDVLFRALAKRPADRYETITEFASALTVAAADPGAGAGATTFTIAGSRDQSGTVSAPVAAPVETGAPINPSEFSQPSRETSPTSASLSGALDVTQVIDRVPRTPYRAVLLGLIALCLIGVVIAKGWIRELPELSDDIAISYRNLFDRINHRAPLPQPTAHAASNVGATIGKP
jgi:serine/threonine protein kinase